MSKKIYTVSKILVLLIAGGAAAFGISRHVQNAEAFWGMATCCHTKTGRTDRLFPNRCILKREPGTRRIIPEISASRICTGRNRRFLQTVLSTVQTIPSARSTKA